jgi:RimJ/RimL family protein N-acetyltransferase
VIREPLATEHLDLVLLEATHLRALLAGSRDIVSSHRNFTFPAEFPGSSHDSFLGAHLRMVEAHPEAAEWCIRAMVRRDDGVAVGHCGFHGPPAVIGRAEIGFTVFSAYRRRGYAAEAAAALLAWAYAKGECRVLAGVAVKNRPSLALVCRLGFRHIGSRIDEVDGEELLFEATSTDREPRSVGRDASDAITEA